VVGAVIDLGNCLDLTTQSGIRVVRDAYKSYVELQTKAGNPLPRNTSGNGSRPEDLVLRHLDRAVIDHLHQSYREASQSSDGRIKEFDTVRALFPEGEPIYENAGFWEKTHVQISIRNPTNVLGVFRVPQHQLDSLGLPNIYSGM
jgi:hypothetical protein